MVDVGAPSPGGMDGVGLDSSTVTPGSPAKGSKSNSQSDSEDVSSAGITAAASHHALLMQGNPSSFSTPSEQGSTGIESIGTLNVGDRFASTRQNSPQTAQAAASGVSGTATFSLTVPQGASATDPAPPISSPASSPQASTNTKSSSFIFSGFSSGHHSRGGSRSGEDEEFRRAFIQGYIQGSSPSPVPVGGTPVSPSAADVSPGTQRYVFNVHDVHDMGGTPSRLSILDAQSGDVLKSYDLAPGDSTLIADLPPGQYTIEAQSGSRSGNAPNAGPDDLDNFRVEIGSAGATPSDGGASGGGAGTATGD